MIVKQFLLGYEAKQYLLAIKEWIRIVDFGGDNSVRIENGYVLNKIIENTDIFSVDWDKVIKVHINVPETTDKEIVGKTVKFKLKDSCYSKINDLVVFLSDSLNMRIYRAYAVKLFLKNYYLINCKKNK